MEIDIDWARRFAASTALREIDRLRAELVLAAIQGNDERGSKRVRELVEVDTAPIWDVLKKLDQLEAAVTKQGASKPREEGQR